MYFRHIFSKHSLISFLELAFVMNLIILDVAVLGKIPLLPLAATTNKSSQTITSPLAISPTPSPCNDCVISPTLAPSPQIKYIQVPVSTVKDYFVPFGSGQNSSSDWQNVTGLQAYIDNRNYPNIKSVVFEASIHIPTGNESANIRLFNSTDQHPVWFSEVSLAGGDPKFLISQPITLDTGNKLYQVQMKTQLQYPAILDQARIHITLN